MPRLIFISEFDTNGPLSPFWYFPDTVYDRDSRPSFTVASGYPFELYMHADKLEERPFVPAKNANKLRIEMRKFIESSLGEDVIFSHLNKIYRVYYGYVDMNNLTDEQIYGRRDTHEVNHVYNVFSFANETDRVVFKLRFSENLDELCDDHPRYEWAKDRRWIQATRSQITKPHLERLIMIFVETPNVEDLSDSAAAKQAIALFRGLAANTERFREMDGDYLRTILSSTMEALDQADDMDCFGSEGWREFLS